MRRPRRLAVPGEQQGALDGALVVGRPLAQPRLVRVAAAADQLLHGQAVGDHRRLGQQAEPGGDLAGRPLVDRPPVEVHRARCGPSAAAPGPRRSVLLPQALGPISAVISALGHIEAELLDDRLPP